MSCAIRPAGWDSPSGRNPAVHLDGGAPRQLGRRLTPVPLNRIREPGMRQTVHMVMAGLEIRCTASLPVDPS